MKNQYIEAGVALLQGAKARLQEYEPLPNVGICFVLSRVGMHIEAKYADGVVHCMEVHIGRHISKCLEGQGFIQTWLHWEGHITADEYTGLYHHNAQLLERLRATRIAWIDHMINCLKKKGKLE